MKRFYLVMRGWEQRNQVLNLVLDIKKRILNNINDYNESDKSTCEEKDDKIIMKRTTLQVWIHGLETLRNVQERSSETPFSNVQQCSETVHKRICCRGSEYSFIMVKVGEVIFSSIPKA